MPTLPMVGDELAGYRLRGVLGRGGMSVVYEAENPRLGSTVALKVLAPELATDDVFRARFLKESRTAASLNHPNVIPIYDMGTHEDLLFIAMRYVAGQDLRGVLKAKHVLAPEQAVLVCGQAGRALDVAHRHGLVHRDVKPGNILVEHGADEDEPDHIYLTDFGITKHAASRSGLTATGEFMGTIDYIAPEQIQGRPVDGRADIYSLGCVLYECLTGRVPFAKDVDAAVIWAHVEEMPTTPSTLQPTLPREIDEVISKALAKDPADRYATCREFIAAARGAIGAPAATDTGTSHTATILAGPAAAAAAAAAAAGATAAAPSIGRDATAPQQAPGYFPPAPPGPAREQSPGGAPPAGPPPGGKPRIRLDRRLVAGLSALALVIVAVGGFLIYREHHRRLLHTGRQRFPHDRSAGRLEARGCFAVPGAAAARGGAGWQDLAGRWPDRLQPGSGRQGNGQDGVLRPGVPHLAHSAPVCRSRCITRCWWPTRASCG